MIKYEHVIVTFCADKAYSIRAAVPLTADTMAQGLQRYTKLPDGYGMLFPSEKWPKPEKIPMWQASVHYPLAMVFLGADGKISTIENVDPGDKKTYDHMALACLEMPLESAVARGLRPGVRWHLGYGCA